MDRREQIRNLGIGTTGTYTILGAINCDYSSIWAEVNWLAAFEHVQAVTTCEKRRKYPS